MLKFLIMAVSVFFTKMLAAQELYVFTDPASNVPAKSVVLKSTAMLGTKKPLSQRYGQEVTAGVSKKLMLRAGTTFSNMMQDQVGWESFYLYGKYRFLSNDEVHAHFRMAAFAEFASSRNESFFDEINIQGDVSGVQAGLIATQLKNKTAISLTAAYVEAFRKTQLMGGNFRTNKALAYSISAGQLLLPRVYKNYNQVNFNIYAELLGQKALDSDAWFVDIAPAAQLIFKSNTKLNFGYRFQLDGRAERFMRDWFVVSLEHTFFNALKK